MIEFIFNLRIECDKLRKELQYCKDNERDSEIEILREQKDQEIKNQKLIWQQKINELLEEVLNFLKLKKIKQI